MTYPRICLHVTIVGAFVALFWSIWLLIAELAAGGFATIPAVTESLTLINGEEGKVLWLLMIPEWLAGLSRAATDPLTFPMLAAILLVLWRNDQKSIADSLAVGFLTSFFLSALISDIGVIGFLILMSLVSISFGLFVRDVRRGIATIVISAILVSIFAGGVVGIISLAIMSAPYLVFGFLYLLYRGCRDIAREDVKTS